jgi:hypothetical protein
MPYYCSCQDDFKNTITSTILSKPEHGSKKCTEILQVQFRIYKRMESSTVMNWAETFTLTPQEKLLICKEGNDVTVPWTSITESLMEVTTVNEDYGDVKTTIAMDGTISFDKFDVAGRCNGQCPLNFDSISSKTVAIHPFQSTT